MHFDVPADATAELTASLEPGRYLAQVHSAPVWWVRAPSEPTTSDDMLYAGPGEFFRFTVDGRARTWVRRVWPGDDPPCSIRYTEL